jgi:hypothetical protein
VFFSFCFLYFLFKLCAHAVFIGFVFDDNLLMFRDFSIMEKLALIGSFVICILLKEFPACLRSVTLP